MTTHIDSRLISNLRSMFFGYIDVQIAGGIDSPVEELQGIRSRHQGACASLHRPEVEWIVEEAFKVLIDVKRDGIVSRDSSVQCARNAR